MKLTKEIKIALVAIVGILIMYFGINFLKGMNLFSTNNAYYMTFDDIQGLGASTPIYADGYKVGIVDGLEYDYKENGPIKVKVDIIKDLRIPQGSKAEIVKDLMGNLQVNLLLANNPRERVLLSRSKIPTMALVRTAISPPMGKYIINPPITR